MSNVLFLCPTHRDHREIEVLGLQHRHQIHFHDYASLLLGELVAHEPPVGTELADPRDEIRRILACYRGVGIDGVVSTDDYPGSSLASIVASQLGLPGVAPAVNLCCQHKYYSRLEQQRLVPQAVPVFQLCEEGFPAPRSLPYPVFVKPVKSFFSVGAYRVGTEAELFRLREKSDLGATFFDPFETLLKEYAGLDLGVRTIVEDLLQGAQATIEGYVQHGQVQIIGVVDSIMFPNTLSFQRFEYPSSLPPAIQERMADLAQTVMTGIGFDHVIFAMRTPRRATMTGRFGLGENIDQLVKQFQFSLDFVPDVFHLALQKNMDVFITDTTDPKIASRIPDWHRQTFNAGSFMVFPITVRDKHFGMIYGDAVQPNSITIHEEEIKLLRTLRNQAVLAVRQSA